MNASVSGALHSREITHKKTLTDARPENDAFFSAVAGLGDKWGFPAGRTDRRKERAEDLRWWSALVGRMLEEGKTDFGYANGRDQDHSPSALQTFLGIRRTR